MFWLLLVLLLFLDGEKRLAPQFHSALRTSSGQGASPFTEEAIQRGVNYVTDQVFQFGEGTCFADLDGDGDPDLIAIGRADGVVGVFENDGNGHFTDHSATTGAPLAPKAKGVIAGDYDNDGDLDIYISQGFDWLWDPDLLAPNLLLRNEGGFIFTDVSAEAGVADDGPGYGCAWADYDLDGYLDLYVSNRFLPNLLYHNLGDGTFEDVAVDLGVDRADDPTYQSVFFDFDHDHDPDLYVANDKADCALYSNHLFENVGGTFVDITESSGTQACVWAMCIAVGDFSDNGHQDMYITNLAIGGNALLINEGDGTFTHQEVAAGVESNTTGWGAVFFDYDNDTHLDLYVCNSVFTNRLYRHEGAWPCVNTAAEMGVADPGPSYSVSTADLDNDGDLDFALMNTNLPLKLYINHEGEQSNWVKFKVVGEGIMHYAVGAAVRIRTGSLWQIREVIAGSNYLSQNELTVHFGVDAADVIDVVEVVWSGGNSRTLSSLAANTTWTLIPHGKLGDADADGDQDLNDFVVLAGCYDTVVIPGCEVMDFDGNGTIEFPDFEAFMMGFDGEPADCNDNEVIDMQEILLNPGLDANGDGQLDDCECPADIDGDGDVDVADLLQLIAQWGPCQGCPSDIDGDDVTDVADLLVLLAAWGTCL